jgi:hypothetical protein
MQKIEKYKNRKIRIDVFLNYRKKRDFSGENLHKIIMSNIGTENIQLEDFATTKTLESKIKECWDRIVKTIDEKDNKTEEENILINLGFSE